MTLFVTRALYTPINTINNNIVLTIKSDMEDNLNTVLFVNLRDVKIIIPTSVTIPKKPPIQTAPRWYKWSLTPNALVISFGINNPETCPRNTGIIPMWNRKLPIINCFFSINSLDFAVQPNWSYRYRNI